MSSSNGKARQRISLGPVNRSNMSKMLHTYMLAHDVTAERAFDMLIRQLADTRDLSTANNKDIFASNFKSTRTAYLPTSKEVHAYMKRHGTDQATAFLILKDRRIVSSISRGSRKRASS